MNEAAEGLSKAITDEMNKLEAAYRCGLRYLPMTVIFAVLIIFMVVTL